jgi:hypothetical protein
MTGELTGELERTAGVSDIKKAVQTELAGVKSTVDSATKSVSSSMSGAASSVNKSVSSAANAAKGTTSAAKSTTASAAKSGTSATASAKTTAAVPKPTASKKDPLADVSFFEDPGMTSKIAAASSAIPASELNGKFGSNGNASMPAVAQIPVNSDALGRARQRRLAAGYNRRIS